MTSINKDTYINAVFKWAEDLQDPTKAKQLTSAERKEIDEVIKYIASNDLTKNAPSNDDINRLTQRISDIKVDISARKRSDNISAKISRAFKNVFAGRISSTSLSLEMKSFHEIKTNVDFRVANGNQPSEIFNYLKVLSSKEQELAFSMLKTNQDIFNSLIEHVNLTQRQNTKLPTVMKEFKSYFAEDFIRPNVEKSFMKADKVESNETSNKEIKELIATLTKLSPSERKIAFNIINLSFSTPENRDLGIDLIRRSLIGSPTLQKEFEERFKDILERPRGRPGDFH